MKHLYVWMHREDDSFRLAGELATTAPVSGGRFQSEFEYSEEWRTDVSAFALDPVSLPLQPSGRRFPAEQFYPPLAVFDDALPDDWGRRLLAQSLKQEGRPSAPADLLVRMQGRGTGALMFTETPALIAPRATLTTTSLPTLLSAAAAFESGTLPPNDAFRTLVEGSSHAGGARPKALVHDDEGEWVAKFPSAFRDGDLDVVGLEGTCLILGRDAGLTVPSARLQTVGRRRVLLVRRFDVTPRGGRVHMVSMRTLCREQPGVYALGYSDLARVIEKHSAAPGTDVSMLFRHMVFNAAIGNVDDHLKNFWMISTPAGYRLAPAFDLVPDITGRGDHTLAFEYSAACPNREQLLAISQQWSVAEADRTLDQVISAVKRFAATAKKLGVRVNSGFERVRTDIQRRIGLIEGARE